ncbi:cobyrinic acid a,c-diamide synthase [Rhodococcus sp. Leaf7]|uniref:cobyrinate a,c-diamide synthase n=1 Tax=unclassified Rhodococcus (in: high G+C Gram-positive bacteria) TaxID=192944 RepID=UPI0006F33E55|nr:MULTISPECIES: cobyrinate a,c-diamide synthase [unclassified Rhodococcus (in: high G+C Gram-positive bacteria)]KQU02799.1 cobyrinic acid a,c-diamide synthase [Rhodococcus sp. Leaf7]KQU38597.1 cobyrinic acid a,c-diamide synthase [Rhodococcus sp. Leaf247]
MVNDLPAVVIAAPSSGSGKTTVATGIMGALRAAGRRVAPFKVGPDYIDPGYHAVAAGRPGRNLDAVMMGRDAMVPSLRWGSAGCDIAVVEGVMGLFDGRIDLSEGAATEPGAEGSTAAVASAIGAPVVLVVDARGHSQSIGALVHGFSTYDPSVRIAGVILNRVGSPRHEAVLRQACDRIGVPVIGSVPRAAALEVPSRHLGLVTAAEHGSAAVDAVSAMTALATQHVDLEELSRIADSAHVPAGTAWDPREAAGPTANAGTPVIAMAGGPAFTFGYAEHVEVLRAAGADVAVFDPRHDRLPEGTSGLVVPGGFPELHAAELAANELLLHDIRDLVDAGHPVHGECAGLLYLAQSLDGHRMAGVLDLDVEFGSRLTLGYRDAVAVTDSVMFDAGTRVTGHEFHRTSVSRRGTADNAWGWRRDGASLMEGAVASGGRVHASYLHTHPVATAAGIARFVAASRPTRETPQAASSPSR